MQIKKRLFLSDGELMRSIDLLTKLEDNDQDKMPSVSSIAAQFIQEQAGNLIPPELRSERAAQKRGALSINDAENAKWVGLQNRFLSKKLDELVARNNSTDRTFDLNEKYQILNKRDILQDIRDNKKQVYDTYEDDLAGLKVTRFRKKGERSDEQRLHHLPFDQSRYWVWLDYAKEWP